MQGVSYIPDSAMFRASIAYSGPPYPMFKFLPYRDEYKCRYYWLETIPASVVGQQRGYFRALEYPQHSITRIKERRDNRWLLWMSNTEMEIHSHMAHVANAHGVTVVCGLGLGMVAYAFARKPEVEKVYVVERNPFLRHHFPKMLRWTPAEWLSKVEILSGDVLLDQFDLPPVDFMYCDTWATLGSEQGLEHTYASYHRLLRGQKPKAVGMWGQETEYLGWCAKTKADFQHEDSYNRFVDDTGLPFLMGLPTWDEYRRTIEAHAWTVGAQAMGIGDGFVEEEA